MAIPLSINGAIFEYPENFDENWGVAATGWAQAVTNGMLQRQGGSFPLLADVNFGTSFGILSKYYKSSAANIAASGVVRLANSESVVWRNDANIGDLPLTVNSLDELTFNGLPIAGGSGAVTSIIGTANQIIASSPSGVVTLSTPQDINTTSSVTFAQITDSGLATNQLVISDGTNKLSNLASPTFTELGYLSGSTSNIQVQLGAISSQLPNYLLLTGGTMSGNIVMNSHGITNLPNGSLPTDAAAFGQIPVFQTVQVLNSTFSNFTSLTFVPITGYSLSITPTSSSYKIKLTVSISATPAAGDGVAVTLFRGATELSTSLNGFAVVKNSATTQNVYQVSFTFVDSPATTSPLTYTIQGLSLSGGLGQIGGPAVSATLVAEEVR